MEFNWTILFIAALIPQLVGAIYFNSRTLGKFSKANTGNDRESRDTKNKILVFGLFYLFGLFLAFAVMSLVVHQLSVFGVFGGVPGIDEEGTEVRQYLVEFMNQYGNYHRNFTHGAIHGAWGCLTFALPLIAINGMYQRKGWKFIFFHFGYWLLTLVIMGGLICHFL